MSNEMIMINDNLVPVDQCVHLVDTDRWVLLADTEWYYFQAYDTGDWYEHETSLVYCSDIDGWVTMDETVYFVHDLNETFYSNDELIYCADIDGFVTQGTEVNWIYDLEVYHYHDDDIFWCDDIQEYVSDDCQIYWVSDLECYYYHSDQITYLDDLEEYVSVYYDYYYCDNCGTTNCSNHTPGHETDDGMICNECFQDLGIEISQSDYNDNVSYINGYHNSKSSRDYTPFYQDDTDGLLNRGKTIGLELEIDDGPRSRRNRLAYDLRSEHQELMCERDGSLSSGFEIITQPMTYNYFINNLDLDGITQKALKAGFRSHDTRTCGLHIHLSSKFFGDNEIEICNTLSRVLLLYVRFFPNEISRLSRRGDCTFSRRPSMHFEPLDSEPIRTTEKIKELKHRTDRYSAVNLDNLFERGIDTVEFRNFKGTLKASTIRASVQFLMALVDYARKNTAYNCTIVKFETIFKNYLKDYTGLKNYMIERNITKGVK